MLLSKHVWNPSEPKAEFHKRKLKAAKWGADVFLPYVFPNLKELLSAQIFHLQNSICAVYSTSLLGDMQYVAEWTLLNVGELGGKSSHSFFLEQ